MRTIRHHVDQRAATRPADIYLLAPETGAILTYAGLQEHARGLAGRLSEFGIRAGDTVALMMPNGFQAAALLLGVMYAGRIAAPVNLLSQPAQIAYVIEHSDARLVLVSRDQEDRLRDALARFPAGAAVQVIVLDVDATEPLGPPQQELPEVAEAADALLMYTSGTTGKPKGVMLTQRAVVAGGEFTTSAHALTPADRVLCALPLYHINGQIVTAVAPLVSGGSVVMPHKFSASNYWETAAAHGVTWLNFVPTIVSYLLAGLDPRAEGLDVARIRFARSASAPLPPELHRAFEERFGIGIIETMGMTETAAPCFTNPLDPARRKIGSPGQAYGNEGRIADPEGRPVADGTPGEICVRGENVMRCYYKQDDVTAAAFWPGGWLRSGDLGHRDADGFFFVTGRLKELIIKGGENIAPREIDEALLKHPAVLEAAATAMPDPHYGQEIYACVMLREGSAVTPAELLEFARGELGRYKTPKCLRIVSDLPRGPSGKVQRLKLLEAFPPE